MDRAESPLTDSWFRSNVYKGKLFRTKIQQDVRANNPSGKKYYVDLNSIDEYLGSSEALPNPQKSWPVEKAYYKFKKWIPAGVSMLAFKRLVKSKAIKSFTRASVVHVRLEAVRAYFQDTSDVDKDEALQMGAAYDYYCSRCTDPVAKPHFIRFVTQGEIEGGEKVEGTWRITPNDIDDFLEKYPTGRMRANRNSRVAKGQQEEPEIEAPAPEPEPTPEPEPEPEPTKKVRGQVSLSMSSYGSPEEAMKAIQVLTDQGFEVSVKP